jgi:hypothetical protein
MKPGYILLLTVLSVGIITSTVAIAILLLGLSIERNSYALQISTQSYEFTQSCTEQAIERLRNNLEYTGNEEIYIGIGSGSSTTGKCTVRPIKGFWNNDRIVCTEATYGNFTKRRQVVHIDTVLPNTIIRDWEEVAFIEECEAYAPATCGNSITENKEQCDDGGDSAVCNIDCTFASCGDGYTNTLYTVPLYGIQEECDTEGESESCNLNCTVAICGDGIINVSADEQCDGGGVDTFNCNADCSNAACGDGYINTAAGEQCDGDGTGNGGETGTCDSDCSTRTCGDGVVNITAGEECDGGAGCTAGCTIATTNEPTDYIAYWKFEETSNSDDAIDSTSNGYTCEQRSGASVSGLNDVPASITAAPVNSDRSRDFDGNNDYLRCDNTSAFSPEPITVSYWVYSDETPQTWDAVLCATNGQNWTRGWGFYFNGSNQLAFFIQDYWTNRAEATITAEGQWNHVLGSWDGDTIRLYINGVEGASDSYSGNMSWKQLQIGRCGHDDYNLNGRIDDLRIYDRILTNAEINALATGT